METLYDLKDVCIIPSAVSEISSRRECNPMHSNSKLPVFNAPMSVLMADSSDIKKLYDEPINVVIPRSFTLEERLQHLLDFPEAFIAIGLAEMQEVSDFITKEEVKSGKVMKPCVLIDIANGHMRKLIDSCKALKENHPNMLIMAGNIANPETLIDYERAGIDFVRCSVGSGFGCITTPSTGIYYPLASLMRKCREIKNAHKLNIKLIADGGIDTFSKICKCLALGADYVMCGKMFAQCEDINSDGVAAFKDRDKFREYYGMASKKGQEAMNLETIKTEEGRCTRVEVKYTLQSLCTMINDYIRSSMSYSDCRTLKDFTSGRVKIALVSSNASVIFDRN